MKKQIFFFLSFFCSYFLFIYTIGESPNLKSDLIEALGLAVLATFFSGLFDYVFRKKFVSKR